MSLPRNSWEASESNNCYSELFDLHVLDLSRQTTYGHDFLLLGSVLSVIGFLVFSTDRSLNRYSLFKLCIKTLSYKTNRVRYFLPEIDIS